MPSISPSFFQIVLRRCLCGSVLLLDHVLFVWERLLLFRQLCDFILGVTELAQSLSGLLV